MSDPKFQSILRRKPVRRALAALVLLTVIAAVFWALRPEVPDPVYKGKRFSAYVKALMGMKALGQLEIRLAVLSPASRAPTMAASASNELIQLNIFDAQTRKRSVPNSDD